MAVLPLVTIITPSFNQVAYLEQAIRSVLEQDYPNLEYYVMDGGSTDGSLEMIEKFAPRLAGWVSEPDRGQADGVNKGLARARGEIIGWLNSDDLYLPGAIASAVEALQAHPQAGMVFSDVQAIDAAGRVTNVMRYGDWGLEDLMTFHIIGQPGVFMRHSALQQVGLLDLRYRFLLDHQLWLRLAQVAPMVHVKAIWAAGRFHPAAKNVAQAPRFGHEAYAIVEWMRTQPALAEPYAYLEKRILAGAHRMNARYLLDGGLAREALRSYGKSLRAHPPTALSETHRMLYAGLSLIGLGGIKPVYFKLRQWIRRT
ncbi:MAG: glycosyltransferase family 2 protein [Anaerolineaceae bacterium]|nr:glycosyltransferase family 2 protein [Anaerolineaceae bacterium]